MGGFLGGTGGREASFGGRFSESIFSLRCSWDRISWLLLNDREKIFKINY